MQQWLNLVPMVGAVLNLSAAMTNLAITIINRRGTPSTTSDQDGNDIAANHLPSRCGGPAARAARPRTRPA